MKKYKLLWQILKRTNSLRLLGGYLAVLVISAVLIMIFEPNINSLGDSLWYCYVTLATIGFGDIVSVTVLGRIVTVVVSLYSIVMIALIPGIITSYYIELTKLKRNESTEKFLNDLQRLPELSKEELQEISDKVKKLQKKD